MTEQNAGAEPILQRASPFQVSFLPHVIGGLIQRFRGLLLGLAHLETRQLSDQLNSIPITMPVYVCGLARSGTTLLHEILAAHPRVATHRVKDYPLVYTPVWWRRATRRRPPTTPTERAHGDRVLISSESPEALEEMVWMAFFPHCHDPSVSNHLTAEQSHPEFETFYRAHIRKLLLVEGAERYVSKANYHVARLLNLVSPFSGRPLPHSGPRTRRPYRVPDAAAPALFRRRTAASAGLGRDAPNRALRVWPGSAADQPWQHRTCPERRARLGRWRGGPRLGPLLGSRLRSPGQRTGAL